MANKLAGQKAKFTKALADFNRTDDEEERTGSIRRMVEVLQQATGNGFSEVDVTGGRSPPGDVRRLMTEGEEIRVSPLEDPEQLVQQLAQMVDTSDLREEGVGNQYVYAYGYRCAPGRLKIGRTDRDVISRVTEQISTGTPERPSLFLTIRTSDCRALESIIHSVLRLRDQKISGGGSEWFFTNCEELLEIYRFISARVSKSSALTPDF